MIVSEFGPMNTSTATTHPGQRARPEQLGLLAKPPAASISLKIGPASDLMCISEATLLNLLRSGAFANVDAAQPFRVGTQHRFPLAWLDGVLSCAAGRELRHTYTQTDRPTTFEIEPLCCSLEDAAARLAVGRTTLYSLLDQLVTFDVSPGRRVVLLASLDGFRHRQQTTFER